MGNFENFTKTTQKGECLFKKFEDLPSQTTSVGNTKILATFLVWDRFLQSFGRNTTEIVPFHKISTPGNQMKFRYFTQAVRNSFFEEHVRATKFTSRKTRCTCSITRCSQKFRKTHMKTPVPESLFQKSCKHSCFPVNFAKFLGTPFLKEHFRWLSLISHLINKNQVCYLIKLDCME